MKILYILVLLAYSSIAKSQPTVTKIENFPIGWNLIFRNVNPSGVLPGKGGANQTWDFSGVTLNPDSTTERMVEPSSTPNGGDFPGANLVEKYSDGWLDYVNKTDSVNYLVGEVYQGLEIKFSPKSISYAKRPMTYRDSISKSYTLNYSAGTSNYRGGGTVDIVADGYGTLKLPNGIYNNVLRLKIIQTEKDTALPAGTFDVSTAISYVWFDDSHYSSLLKIASSYSGASVTKSVQYLLEENLSGFDNPEVTPHNLSASIHDEQLRVGGDLKTGKEYHLGLCDMLGKEIFQTSFVSSGAPAQTLQLPWPLHGVFVIDLHGDDENGTALKVVAE